MGYRGRKQRPPDTAAAPQSSQACSTLKGSARHSPVPFFSLTRVIGAVSLKSCHCQSRNSKSSEEFLTPHCRIIACSIWAEFNYYTRIQVFPGCKVACLPGEGRRALEGGGGRARDSCELQKGGGRSWRSRQTVKSQVTRFTERACLAVPGTTQPPGEG